ncbi:MAG: GTPase HflX [Acidimicrobiia bacterium]|nr:GTPase HflX [Acidimicrobiia bacterium]
MSDGGRQRRRLTATITDLEVRRQRAFLIAAYDDDQDERERSLAELALLTETAGSDPIETELVRRPLPDPATFIGRGKAAELAAVTESLDIDVVVFDNSLTPAQQRNLQEIFGCDVVDREALILDIFAQHATSREGMLQVELALLRYHLPRLRGQGTKLSRQAGGIGTRGPGETKLESDRRRILSRISKLERDLRSLDSTRATQRKARRKSDLAQAALVGYTNAGKSTLLNHLTGAAVLTQDQLFTTLDPTVRRLDLGNRRAVLLSDTVGFVRRLPHSLVEAFRSTLEEVSQSDLMLHIVDAGEPSLDEQIAAVRSVLEEIGAAHLPELLVINKIDMVDDTARARLARLYPDAVAVSALYGEGTEQLTAVVDEALQRRLKEVDLTIPYERGDILAAVHRAGEVVKEEHLPEGTRIHARLPEPRLAGFEEFATPELAPETSG